MLSFKSFRSGFSFYRANIHTHTHTPTHTHTHTHHDKVIALSAPPYYVVSADTALRQWLVPAVADEPTTHVVPFYIHCVNCFINELVSCINK